MGVKVLLQSTLMPKCFLSKKNDDNAEEESKTQFDKAASCGYTFERTTNGKKVIPCLMNLI